jgi:hypothetical protein
MDKLFGAGVPIPPELARVFPDRRATEGGQGGRAA